MQISRDELEKGLRGLLGDESNALFDNGANCLQVKGANIIQKVVSGVSASLDLFEKAVEMNAQAIIVHHGLWFPSGGASLNHILASRLKMLLENDISLFSYHYLLDIHPQIGNAAGIARLIGGRIGDQYGFIDDHPWGYEVVFPHSITQEKLLNRLEKIRGSKLSASYQFGSKKIERIGLVTGSGSGTIEEAANKKLDGVIVGDIKEGTQADAKESNMNVYAIGHYRSETPGPRALADWIIDQYGVEANFIDIPNLA